MKLLLLLIPFLFIPTVNAEAKSFFECYTSFSSQFLLFNQLLPTTIDLTDPKMKAYISNICNFYHEKTGIWVDSSYNDPIDNQIDYYTLGKEFNQKYGNTMPDSMKEFANMSVLGD